MYRYDEETGDMWDDGAPQSPTFPGTRCGGGQSGGTSSSNHVFDTILCYAGIALAIFGGCAYLSSHDVFGRIEDRAKGRASPQMVRQDARSGKAKSDNGGGSLPASGAGTMVIARCCVCQAQLDITNLMHLHSFDCICPKCNSRLHVSMDGGGR